MDEIVGRYKVMRWLSIAVGVTVDLVLAGVAYVGTVKGAPVAVTVLVPGFLALAVVSVLAVHVVDLLKIEEEIFNSTLRAAKRYNMPEKSFEELSRAVAGSDAKAATDLLVLILKSLIAETISLKEANKRLPKGVSVRLDEESDNKIETIKLVIACPVGSSFIRLWQSN